MDNKMDNKIKIFYGNKNPNLIPTYGVGSANNDYGAGFYTTPDKELAKEWAWGTYTSGTKGYVHTYEIDTTNLNILDFTQCNSLHWIAELVSNRKLNLDGKEVVRDNLSKFISKYKLDTTGYDIIIGYRADDSYFAFAESFIDGTIYLDTVEKALRTGNLGIQVFIKSEEAFTRLVKIGIEEVDIKYRNHFLKRDKAARNTYNQLKINQSIRNKQTIHDFL